MPPDQNQPQAAAAITATNPTLPVADGDAAMETSVRVSAREEVDFDTWGDDDPFAHFDFEDLVDTVEPAVVLKPKRLVDPVAAKSAKCAELQGKLTKKLNLRSEWDGFGSLSEEIMFIAFEDLDEKQTEKTYEAIIDYVKKMEKRINTRSNEFKDRAVSLKELKDAIVKLDPSQYEMHLVELSRARLLIEQMETQLEMEKFEDPIVLCSELDRVRKKIQKNRRPPVENFASTPIEDIIFNVERNDFNSFIGQLRNRLADNDQYEKLQDSYLLPLQTVFEQPSKWIRIHLLGIGPDRIAAYLRGDNGYFAAWGINDVIFEMGRPNATRLFPDSILVDCDASYPSMMNFEKSSFHLPKVELKKRLKALKLNRKKLLKDIRILSKYTHPPATGDIARFQQALARIAVMICEVCRIIQIWLAVVAGWIDGTHLDDLFLEYIWRWKLMSRAFLKWRDDETIKLSEKLQDWVKMEYAREVGKVLFLVLNYKRGKDENYVDQMSDSSDDDDEDQDDQEEDGDFGIEIQPGPGGGENDQREVQHGDTSGNEDATSSNSGLINFVFGDNEGREAARAAYFARNRSRAKGQSQVDSRSTERHYIPPMPITLHHKARHSVQKKKKARHFGMVGAQTREIIRMEAPAISPPCGLVDIIRHLDKQKTVCTRLSKVSSLTRLGMADSRRFSVFERYTGQILVEIFKVSATFPFFGTILICDQHSSKIICKRDNWRQTNNDFSSGRDKWVLSGNPAVQFKDNIELIGPSGATTADSGFDIVVFMPATRRKASEICKLSFNCDESKLYNKVKTYPIKTERGWIYVTCSVLPDALEAFLEVKLQLPSEWMHDKSAKIYGCITARMDKFDLGSTLMDKDANEAVPLALPLPGGFTNSPLEGYTVVRVPLTRSILAVSLEEDIHLKGTLHICGRDDIPISIDRCLNTRLDYIEEPWKKNGETFSSLRMSLGPIF